MATRDIVVIGSSAGGIQALVELVSLLPARLPAALVMVVHTRSTAPSALPSILSKAGPLPASHPEQGTPITHVRFMLRGRTIASWFAKVALRCRGHRRGTGTALR